MAKLASPSGDLGVKRAGELTRAFPRRIKRAGTAEASSKRLPVRKHRVA